MVARRLLAAALEPPRERDPGRNPAAPKGVSFSAGITSAPRFGTAQVELYRQADAALYWSKRHGRTDVTIFDSARHDLGAALASIDDATAVQTVLAAPPAGRLPAHRGAGDRPHHRLRGPHPADPERLPDPGAMFMAAEACGRTLELDRACLETVAAAAAAIPADKWVSLQPLAAHAGGPEVQCPGPVPPAGPPGPALAAHRAGVDGARGHRGPRAAPPQPGGARALGVRVAADDVGAATPACACSASSRSTWSRWTCRWSRMATRQTSAHVLETLPEISARRGAMVVAEGLETAQQLQVVRAAGIEAAQGYLLGRPAEAVDQTPSTWTPWPSATTCGGSTPDRPRDPRRTAADRSPAVGRCRLGPGVVQPKAIPVPCLAASCRARPS